MTEPDAPITPHECIICGGRVLAAVTLPWTPGPFCRACFDALRLHFYMIPPPDHRARP